MTRPSRALPYDLWVLGPNGYHRHFSGHAAASPLETPVCYDVANGNVYLKLSNSGRQSVGYVVAANAYLASGPWSGEVPVGGQTALHWSLSTSGHWYDFSVALKGTPGYLRRFAGRVETGEPSVSDPAMDGPALGDPYQP